MKYYLKPVSRSLYAINRSRTRCGRVQLMPEGDWAAVGEKHSHRAATPQDAFRDWVRTANRLAVCGEDDAVKALNAVVQRNNEAREEVASINRAAGRQIVRLRSRGRFIL